MIDARSAIDPALGDRYRIVRELGSGGMATVYLARDAKHGRDVAIKVLRRELAASIGGERFLQEIDILARLRHPHILPLHDSGAVGDVLFYVMPYVAGETLRQRLTRERQLPLPDALRIADEVADALGYAHALGVVHRDVKPENILLEAGHAVVADFGIARAVGEAGSHRLTETGFAIGTPSYMSPEQAAGDRAVDHRADIYALGCVLYEMLSGETPHAGATPQAILARVLTEPARPLTAVRPAVTPALERVVLTALARTPADRYATAAELRSALAAARTAPPEPAPRPGRSRLARRVGLAAVTLLALVLGILAGRRLLQSRSTDGDRLGVAVFPFQATSAAADEWVEQMPDLLATMLDGTPGIRVADPFALWGHLRPERGARARSPADLDDAARLARRARAGTFLLGSVRVDTGNPNEAGSMGVTVRLYRRGDREAFHTVTQTGRADSIGSLMQRVAIDVITRLRPDETAGVGRFDALTSRSAPAVKSYLRAKEAMRRGQIDVAEAAIDSAIAADTTFAIALVEATVIKSWAQQMRGRPFQGLVPLIERASRYEDALPPRARLRLEAVRASIRTDGATAAAAARRSLERDSTDLEAWLGLFYYHRSYGWQYGADETDAIAALDRAIALDSTHVPSLVAMLSLLSHMGDPRANAYAGMLRAADTTSVLARGALLGQRALAATDADFPAFADTAAAQDQALVIPVLRALRGPRPERAMALIERLRLRQGPGVPDYRGEWARYLAAQGRLAALDSAIGAGAFDSPYTARWLLVAPLLADVGDSARAMARAGNLARLTPPDSARAMFENNPVWLNGWMVGAINASFGDSAVARRWQAVIGTLPPGGVTTDYRGGLQADIDARLRARAGDRAGALAAAARAYELWGIHTENASEFQPDPQMRFHWAMLLLRDGKPDSAAALLRSLVPPTTWMGWLTARASLELGRLAEERGDRADAARHYAMAYRLWRGADPALSTWREEARLGLSRTTGEPVAP